MCANEQAILLNYLNRLYMNFVSIAMCAKNQNHHTTLTAFEILTYIHFFLFIYKMREQKIQSMLHKRSLFIR